MTTSGEDWSPDDYADLIGGTPPPKKPIPIRPIRPGDEWKLELRHNTEGVLTKDPGNAALILANVPEWEALHFDDFTYRVQCTNAPTINGLSPPVEPEQLILFASHWLAKRHRQTFSREAVRDALRYAALQRPRRHAVRDWLSKLAWDGTRRIDTWLTDYLGVADTPANREIGRMWAISAVARAYKPGAKVDYMLVIEGHQGAKKTSALEALCGDDWYQPELSDLRNKDSMVSLCGKWIVCMDEMHALRSADIQELAKNYLTRRVDKYRPPYGEHEIERRRSCIFAGTTNSSQYLHDPTGNRRFWPVRATVVDVPKISRDRDQIWAEAKEAYLGGATWWPQVAMQSQINELTEERTQEDTWEQIIARDVYGREWTDVALCLAALGMQAKDHQQREQTRVARILQRIGWERYRYREGDQLTWRYRKREDRG